MPSSATSSGEAEGVGVGVAVGLLEALDEDLDEDLEEAVYTIMKVLGDDPLQTPPDNIMKELFSRGKNILKT